jgi:hypothetical protein
MFSYIYCILSSPTSTWNHCFAVTEANSETLVNLSFVFCLHTFSFVFEYLSQPILFFWTIFTGAVRILRQAQDIDFKLLYTGKICIDELQRIRRIARQDCIRLPYFLKHIASYKRILEEIAILNGLIQRVKRPLSCRSRSRTSLRNKNKKKNFQNKFRILSSPTRSKTHSSIPHPPLLSRRNRSLKLDENWKYIFRLRGCACLTACVRVCAVRVRGVIFDVWCANLRE